MRVRRLTIPEGYRMGIYAYPNFHKSGSVKGMKKQFYGENAMLVLCGSYIYNVPSRIYNRAR